MVIDTELIPGAADHRGVVVWRLPGPTPGLSSASSGGGWGPVEWVANVGVPLDYHRTDLEHHAAEIAGEAGLGGSGTTLFTAARVDRVRRGSEGGVVVDATVGITKPTWAADAAGRWNDWRPGTINLVAQLPVCLTEAAAVNAVITMTEAKAQALWEAGVPGTGTASDAAVVLWTSAGPAEAFAGPRSRWGSRLAQATHAAVAAGIRAAGSTAR